MKIEKNVPVPPERDRQIWPFAQMEVGDSFAIDPSKARAVRNAACQYQMKHEGTRFIVRTLNEKETRVWRTL